MNSDRLKESTNFEERMGFVIQPMKPDVIDFHPFQNEKKIQTNYFIEKDNNENPFTISDVKEFNKPKKESKKIYPTRPKAEQESQIAKPIQIESTKQEVREETMTNAVMLEPDLPEMRKEDFSKPAKLELSTVAKSMYNPTTEQSNPPREDTSPNRQKLRRYEPVIPDDIVNRPNIKYRKNNDIWPTSKSPKLQSLLSNNKIGEDIDFVKFREDELKQRNAETRNASFAIIASILFSLVPLPFLIALCKNLYSSL